MMITQQRLKEVLRYNEDTGEFIWLVGNFKGEAAGSIKTRERGRIMICIDRKFYKAHRLVWLYMTGEWPNGIIDHIDRNPSNNRWPNLRIATISENGVNRDHPLGVLGARGIDERCGGYRAKIKVNGKAHYLGTFSSLEYAIAARKAAELRFGRG